MLVLLFLSACASGVRLDPSPDAVKSGDFTLALSFSNAPCSTLPARGADICRFKELSAIEGSWTIVLPSGKSVTHGELTIYFKDKSLTYAVKGPTVEVPLKDLVGHEKWAMDDTDIATALASVKFLGEDGIEHQFLARGLGILVVLSQSYDPLPLDSGYTAFTDECRIQYSTSGRSVLSSTELSCEAK